MLFPVPWLNSYLPVRFQFRHSCVLRSTALKARFGVSPTRAHGTPNSRPLLSTRVHLLWTKFYQVWDYVDVYSVLDLEYEAMPGTQKPLKLRL